MVLEAENRCRQYLWETPLEHSLPLSRLIEGQVWLKLELMQRTASFKFRGALNKILSLDDKELRRGVIAASTGNFALAVAEAVRLRGHQATVYVASNMSSERMSLLRDHGLHVVAYGSDPWDAEKQAREVARAEQKVYLSPYNDPFVVGGQGTCGLEISRQLPDLDVAFFAVGGGGLISGSGGWLKQTHPGVEIVGVSPENSPVMYESLRANRVVEMETSPYIGRHMCRRNRFG